MKAASHVDVAPELVASAMSRLAPLVDTGVSEACLRRSIELEVQFELERVADLERAREFAEACPVSGIAPGEYLQRIISVTGLGFAVVGIRFLGGDLGRPFVDVVQRTFALDSADAFPALASSACREFAGFRPFAARLFLSAAEEAACGGHIAGEPDFRLVSGRIAFLRSLPRPHCALSIELEPQRDDSFYERYAEGYASFHRAAPPELRELVPVESRETFEPCVEEGTLYRVIAGGAYAGIFATKRARLGGVPGFEVVEEFLEEPFRNRGLAKAVQHRIFEALPAGPDDCITGTIQPMNLPSLRTALGAGRLDLGGFHFLSC